MIPVASLDDPRVAAYRWVAQPERLLDDGLFAVEGRLVVPRLLALSAEPGRWFGAAVSALLSPAAYERMQAVIDGYATVSTYVAPQQVIDGLVGFNMHRGCVALESGPRHSQSLPSTSLTRASRSCSKASIIPTISAASSGAVRPLMRDS